MDNYLLRKLQLTELEILIEIDKICRKNKIYYSLCGGTLIGAVRHKGFVPWDDDLDIRMDRYNYNRFIRVWNHNNPNGYVLQNKENTSKFTQSFTKIRKDHTAFVQYEFEKDAYHTGIFVDVFPFDRIPNGKFRKILFNFQCLKYQVYTRENKSSINSIFLRMINRLFLLLSSKNSRKKYRIKFEKKLEYLDGFQELNRVAIDALSTMRIELPSDITDEYIDLDFEGHRFMCFKKWHEYLSIFFGDYMQSPPKEEQTWKHHPIILDFEHNYEELNN